MSKHMEIKHSLQKIKDKRVFEEVLNNSMLSTKEKKLMCMYYIEKYDFWYIADELGYSHQGILKMHDRILNNLGELL